MHGKYIAMLCRVVRSFWARISITLRANSDPELNARDSRLKFKNKTDEQLTRVRLKCNKHQELVAEATPQNPMSRDASYDTLSDNPIVTVGPSIKYVMLWAMIFDPPVTNCHKC